MAGPELVDDCSRCAALCCGAYPFQSGIGAGIDKPADVPCPHLSGTRCAIHAERAERGFDGCVAYTCHGAGQYITQEMFGGASWDEAPELREPMMAALRDLQPVQEWRALIDAALAMPLPKDRRAEAVRLEAALCPDGTWTETALRALHRGGLPDEVRAFFRSLEATTHREAPPSPRPAADRCSRAAGSHRRSG